MVRGSTNNRPIERTMSGRSKYVLHVSTIDHRTIQGKKLYTEFAIYKAKINGEREFDLSRWRGFWRSGSMMRNDIEILSSQPVPALSWERTRHLYLKYLAYCCANYNRNPYISVFLSMKDFTRFIWRRGINHKDKNTNLFHNSNYQ